VERGGTGLGRGAHGAPRRRRLGDRRTYRPGDGAGGTGARGTNTVNGLGDDEDDEYYGQLLRRPGDSPAYPRQPGRPLMRQPGRTASPADDYPPNKRPGDGWPRNGDAATGAPPNGGPVSGGGYGGPVSEGGYGGPVDAGAISGRQHRLPNGRRVPPAADRLYRPAAPGSAGGTHRRRGPGQEPFGGTWSRPTGPSPAPGAPPGPGVTQAYGSASGSGPADRAGPQPGGAGDWERMRVPPAGRGVPISPGPAAPLGPAGPGGPVIRQRESAVSDERPIGAAPSVASIAPDGLESFARDLRALRAKAELDYPAMAELSHYTMKTLASAAGGLRLPTLPVAVAYVRACGGNVAEWEDRWQKLAAKITADGARKRRGDDGEQQAPAEPADAAAIQEPPAAQHPDPGPGEVYVITSAKPRQPGW